MVKLRNFQEVHRVLQKFIPKVRTQVPYTLERIRALMGYLGNPQNSYKVIHVAGTSGKTSSCYYLSAMLAASGKKVGLSVSPHVDEVNERVQINLQPLTEEKYCNEFSEFLDSVNESGIKPTYFELLVAFAFWEFKRQEVDYAVIEVGMGGLLDGTNVITREDKVCVITDIGLDHIEILGSTLPAIAAQKAGIMHRCNHVFSYAQSEEIMDVLREVSKAQNANLHEISQPPASELPNSLPLFQQRNWYLARVVYHFVAERDKLKSTEQAASTAIMTHIPARMETVSFEGKTIIMDGAHNTQKIEALVDSVRVAYRGESVAVLASFVRTKKSRLKQDMEALLPLANHVIITSFKTPGAPRDSINPEEVVKVCEKLGYSSFEVADDPVEAFQRLIKRAEPILLVTGSFFLLNHIRPLLTHKKS